jgi:hypothetical protein
VKISFVWELVASDPTAHAAGGARVDSPATLFLALGLSICFDPLAPWEVNLTDGED